MRASTTSGHNTPGVTHAYSPSVPLSIYRELAAELQAAEMMLDSVNTQNQHLAQQNQQLRQEIDKAVQTVLHLQQVVESSVALSWSEEPQGTPDFRTQPNRTVNGVPRPMPRSSRPPTVVQMPVKEPSLPTRESSSVLSEKLFTEHEEGRYRTRTQPESASEISGWWLAIAILIIIFTAFGAGYLIVRPLLQSR